ncbi:MAG: hypothetical protein FWD12_00370 [Alphaproteobacteria bacterium]|nr:hypothetical protein [Alphaproteobacteria bacterium]
MTINKRPAPKADDAGEKFIAKAEGGAHAVRWVRGNRTQITLSIAPDLLSRSSRRFPKHRLTALT